MHRRAESGWALRGNGIQPGGEFHRRSQVRLGRMRREMLGGR